MKNTGDTPVRPVRFVAHALVRAASRLPLADPFPDFSTHGVDLDTSVEAARKSACATKNVENGSRLTLMGVPPGSFHGL
jgi:hypothetical protein